MDHGHGEIRTNIEVDKLSNLPDDLIHKILAFISIKHAIRTSVLSSRWKYIWTSLPCLNFSTDDFYSLHELLEFVTHVLSSRNNEVEVSYVELTFCGRVCEAIVERVLDYAFSHNVQQLNITSLQMEFHISHFCSQSLKRLTLNGYIYEHYVMTPPIWELPALETLNLYCVTLYDDNTNKCARLFSNCANLKNLTLKNCRLMGGLNGFNICHPGLTSLTLEDGCKGVNVVTPQLKNLAISNWRRIHLISTPNLSSLRYYDYDYDYDYGYGYGYGYDDDHDYADDYDNDDDYNYDYDYDYYYDDEVYVDADPLQLSTELLHLENVDICIYRIFEDEVAYTRKIVDVLQQLHSVKFLTLNLELVKLLSFSVEVISCQPSPFVNLKGLKIYPVDVTPEEHTQTKVTMSTEVKNYLLDGSRGATFTMVSHEEIRAVKNDASARNLMRELQVLVDEWKGNNEANTQMNREDLEVENGYRNTRCMILMLRKIEGVLAKLPALQRAKLQEKFSGLCAEAESIMDKKPSLSDASLHELATSFHRIGI